MLILDRYFLKNFSQAFFNSNLIFLIIFFIANLVTQIETFIKYQATASQITRYFLNQIPYIYVQVTPMATLLATLFTLGSMSQKNEITVLKASGVSLLRISLPIWLIALTLSGFTIFLNEYVVPHTNQNFRQILNYEIIEKKIHSFGSQTNIAYLGETGDIYYIDFFIGDKDTLQNVTILRYDKQDRLIGRIDAQKAVYQENKWEFFSGVERHFEEKKLSESIPFTKKAFPLKETPADFRKQQKQPAEMTHKELKETIAKIKAAGGDYRQNEVYLFFTISFPLAAFFMSYLAIPFTLFNNRSNPIMSFGFCLIIAFVYWGMIAVSHTLGVSGFLPAFLSAWGANIIFGLLGTCFYALAPQ